MSNFRNIVHILYFISDKMDSQANLSNDNPLYISDSFLKNLFQKVSSDDRFVDHYEEISFPREVIGINYKESY